MLWHFPAAIAVIFVIRVFKVLLQRWLWGSEAKITAADAAKAGKGKEVSCAKRSLSYSVRLA